MHKRPNILILMTDQQRADSLGCYGNKVCRTPNLDRLAEQGALMTNAFVANPLCMPNRATFWTGRYPSAHGVRSNGIPLSYDEITMVRVLAEAGYETASFGKIHLQPSGLLECVFPDGRRMISYESRPYWERTDPRQPRRFYRPDDRMPVPHYGFQQIKLTIGHGEWPSGHYYWWLKENHPDVFNRRGREHALRPPTGAMQSWKSAVPAECHPTRWVCDRTIEFLRTRKDTVRPFLAVCSIPDPHHPFTPPAPYCFMYDEVDIPLPERREGDLEAKPPHFLRYYREGLKTSGTHEVPPSTFTDDHWREIIAHTYGMVTQIDDNLGRVLDCLDQEGLADNTIVLFTSDHGDLLGDHGLVLKGPYHMDGLVRVPMIWRMPGRIPAGRRLDGLFSTADVMDTLLDILGVEPPPGTQGISARAYLEGSGPAPRDALLVENDEEYLDLRLRTLITPDWKITVYAGQSYGELYDRRKDPGEFENLWDSPEHRDVKQALMERLMHALIEADDPLPVRFAHA